MNEEEPSDIIGGEREEGMCVCGKHMRKVSVHLNYVTWKCEFCGRKDTRWEGARPFEPLEDKIGEYSSYLVDIINKVEEKENERI